MDPSIMKLLEEDEDETMHCGADVEAFTAALNRDIEGDTSTSQPSDSDSTALSQGSSYTSNQFLSQWQTSTHDENDNSKSQQDTMVIQQPEPQSAEIDFKQHGLVSENEKPQEDSSQELNHFPLPHKPLKGNSFQSQAQPDMLRGSQTMDMTDSENIPAGNQGPDRTQNSNHEAQLVKLNNTSHSSVTGMSNQQAVTAPPAMSNQEVITPGASTQQAMATTCSSDQQASSTLMRGKQVPFALLLPVIQPQLDKDRAMQLHTLYLKLRKNEIAKEGFVRHMRSIVGDQMLKMAVYKLQSQAARNSQNVPSQLPAQSQAPAQQHQLPTPPAVQMMPDSSNQAANTNALKPHEVEHLSDSHGMQVSQMSTSSLAAKKQDREHSSFPPPGINKQQPQHVHFSQAPFPTYGSSGSNYHPYSAMTTPASTLKQQPHDSQTRQIPAHQSMGAAQLGMANQGMNMASLPKPDRQNSFSDPKRLQGATLAHMTNNSALPQNSVQWQPSSSKEQKNVVPSSMTYVKQEPLDQSNEQPKSQFSAPQGSSSLSSVRTEQGTALPGTLKDETFESQSSRVGLSTPMSTLPSNSMPSSIPPLMDAKNALNSRIPPATPSISLGNNVKALTKKPLVGQKKPLEGLGSSLPPSSKKQKVSGAFSDQSIEQLNDVTAYTNVDLKEEEAQLFSGSKEDSRVSEASRRVVQEEEERLILQKTPLKRKLAEIMAKSGLKSISNDVERCLSLCVEERMRGLIGNLIRLSKQRLDIEKPRHKTIITSDVRQQIMLMNRKAREEWEKKQAETEKLQRPNEPEGNPMVDGEKDEGRAKSAKVAPNKEEDDKMRTTAANVAARAAVGGDDMLSKWQLMAEQARQKREGRFDTASGSQPGKDVGRKLSSPKRLSDNQEAEKKGQSAGTSTPGVVRKGGRNQVIVPHSKLVRSISVKDVISVLEREPQMSRSTLMYRLYEKVRADNPAT